MSQDQARESKESQDSTELKSSGKDKPESLPALEWEHVQSSIPVESFTNYEINFNGWARKDRLKTRLEERAKHLEEEEKERAKKQKLDHENEVKASEKHNEGDEDLGSDDSEHESKPVAEKREKDVESGGTLNGKSVKEGDENCSKDVKDGSVKDSGSEDNMVE
ncbi:LADA_0A04434g1_1 [Lachancea dasiensis]|uniref:LADA_0A04434g1_1 n=1 Tax=Lachancea dasiensis TaxID=1072105 RepID=A0A1G4INX9_9SACH|nr:LADA_0A04434g1_1 [Lachancea dasiensis]